MFRAFFTFDTPEIVLASEARLGFFSGNISILSTFVDKFEINIISHGKREYPGSELVLFYTHPQDQLRFQDGRGAVFSDSLVIGGREMIDDLPSPGSIKEKKILAKMARVTRMARTVARMARWLADLDEPF